jgi:hypothetical protein
VGFTRSNESGALFTRGKGPTIKEHRYSVYKTDKSSLHTMIKRTCVLSDNVELTSVALTTAVKNKVGHGLIFGGRWFDLTNQREPKSGSVIRVATLDPKNQTVVTVTLLGDAGAVFPETGRALVTQAVFGEYRLVILATVWDVPSHYSSNIMHTITAPREQFGDSHQLVQGSCPS